MARPSRLFTAYFVTTQVVLSYVALAATRRFRGADAVARLTRAKHQRNARRIEAAILRLRGLFIKVGQLISIMANFLPDAFREYCRAMLPLTRALHERRQKEEVFQPVWDKGR